MTQLQSDGGDQRAWRYVASKFTAEVHGPRVYVRRDVNLILILRSASARRARARRAHTNAATYTLIHIPARVYTISHVHPLHLQNPELAGLQWRK